MSKYLREQGSADKSIKRQIEGELAWSRLLRRRVEPFVNVSDEEVQAVIARLEAAKGTKEYHVGEIYLSSTAENQAEVAANARKIIEQIRGGGSFGRLCPAILRSYDGIGRWRPWLGPGASAP